MIDISHSSTKYVINKLVFNINDFFTASFPGSNKEEVQSIVTFLKNRIQKIRLKFLHVDLSMMVNQH